MKEILEKRRKLNYTIHDPNTVEDTAKILLDILVQANEKKVERKMRELVNYSAAATLEEEPDNLAEIV